METEEINVTFVCDGMIFVDFKQRYQVDVDRRQAKVPDFFRKTARIVLMARILKENG